MSEFERITLSTGASSDALCICERVAIGDVNGDGIPDLVADGFGAGDRQRPRDWRWPSCGMTAGWTL